MVKLNPEFEESISESMLAFLVAIIDNIEGSPEKKPDQVILDFMQEHYHHREPVHHSFSDILIERVKNEIIIRNLEVNKEYFKDVSQSVMEELIVFFVDYFINDFYNIYKHVEVSDEEYLRIGFRNLINSLDQLKLSLDSMIRLEKWLKQHLKGEWRKMKSIWTEYKEEKISTVTFLKLAIELLDEKLVSKTIRRFLESIKKGE